MSTTVRKGNPVDVREGLMERDCVWLREPVGDVVRLCVWEKDPVADVVCDGDTLRLTERDCVVVALGDADCEPEDDDVCESANTSTKKIGMTARSEYIGYVSETK